MKIKLNFRIVVTFFAFFVSFLSGIIRLSDPEILEVLRLKYFDQLQNYSMRETDGHTYTVIVDIDEK